MGLVLYEGLLSTSLNRGRIVVPGHPSKKGTQECRPSFNQRVLSASGDHYISVQLFINDGSGPLNTADHYRGIYLAMEKPKQVPFPSHEFNFVELARDLVGLGRRGIALAHMAQLLCLTMAGMANAADE